MTRVNGASQAPFFCANGTASTFLRHWRQDSDLAGVRDETALAALPEEEREAWKDLWRDVQTTLDELAQPASFDHVGS